MIVCPVRSWSIIGRGVAKGVKDNRNGRGPRQVRIEDAYAAANELKVLYCFTVKLGEILRPMSCSEKAVRQRKMSIIFRGDWWPLLVRQGNCLLTGVIIETVNSNEG